MSKIFDPKRAGVALGALCLAVGMSACTTVEGTNAFVDAETFEREVASETLRGLGIIEKGEPKELGNARGPLVLPKDTDSLPPPREETMVAQLPEDSDKVQIDTTGLTDEDISRLRNARVVDLRAISGRPLTDEESQKLTARMKAARIEVQENTERPLFLPPDEYFTTVGGQDLICLADNGDLVPLDDPACPPAIRAALESS
mgnify:CR=1 FL=1